jgi:hypothetical protein
MIALFHKRSPDLPELSLQRSGLFRRKVLEEFIVIVNGIFNWSDAQLVVRSIHQDLEEMVHLFLRKVECAWFDRPLYIRPEALESILIEYFSVNPKSQTPREAPTSVPCLHLLLEAREAMVKSLRNLRINLPVTHLESIRITRHANEVVPALMEENDHLVPRREAT